MPDALPAGLDGDRVSVRVSLDGRTPITLPERYAEIVRLVIALIPKMENMGGVELSFRWYPRDDRRGPRDVWPTLSELWPPRALTTTTGGGANAEGS